MGKIKTKNVVKGTIKTLNKTAVGLERTKDVIVNIKERSENSYNSDSNINEYGSTQIGFVSNRALDESIVKVNNNGRRSFNTTKNNLIKSKDMIKNVKTKLSEKRKLNKAKKGIKKTSKKVIKETPKAINRAKQVFVKSVKVTANAIKLTIKVTVKTVKAIISGLKALISAIAAGGWVAVIIIIVICLVGLICGSIFGIFLSSEKTSSNAITMNDVVVELNNEFSNKLQSIQNSNPHDEYILSGSMASWKDILLVYTVKLSNGLNQQDVLTIDDNKKAILRKIFWDMNVLSYVVKTETVIEKGVSELEKPKQVQKRVLHITISAKSIEQMKKEYQFNSLQINQITELSSDEYAILWNGVIYGMADNGDYINWRQGDDRWSNIRIGKTSSTIGEIGCLVTAIAILIEKSGVNYTINPFNPGTFVNELNNNGGFSKTGSLQYAAVNKVVPSFKYMGNVNLRGKEKSEKLALITQYFNKGYYITVEVKGATPGNQHWVAVTDINGNDIIMVDPASDQRNMWNAYKYSKTSQFNYFKAN